MLTEMKKQLDINKILCREFCPDIANHTKDAYGNMQMRLNKPQIYAGVAELARRTGLKIQYIRNAVSSNLISRTITKKHPVFNGNYGSMGKR